MYYEDIFEAIKTNDVEGVKAFLPEQIELRDKRCRTPLHIASYHDHTKIVNVLINAGADIEAKDEDGSTPLHWACGWAGLETIQLLVESGADTNVQDASNNTPLHCLNKNNMEVGKYMIEHGADPYIKNNDGINFMYMQDKKKDYLMYYEDIFEAIKTNDVEGVKAFLPEQIELRDKRCRTPLHIASYHDHTKIVNVLINAGADIEAKDEDGSTPLHWACGWAGLETIQLLVESGADTNVQDASNNTPLHCLNKNNMEVGKYMIEHGADPYIKNNSGVSFLDKLASKHGSNTAEVAEIDNLYRQYLEQQVSDEKEITLDREW